MERFVTTMRQYFIKQATNHDQKAVEDIFTDAALKFDLVDTRLGSLLEHTVCNYSEALGRGFGLGAIRIDDLICVGLNPCRAGAERFGPVFDYIVAELAAAFGDRFMVAPKDQEINHTILPRVPVTEEHRAFSRKLLDANRTDGNATT